MDASASQASVDPTVVASPEAPGEAERQRGIGEFVREAWSQALVAVNATEEEVQKILGRLTTWFEVGPDEARRLGLELSDRLRQERNELEQSIETAVRRALTPFRLPTRDELQSLRSRLEVLETRVDAALARRAASAPLTAQ